jgi:subtilisin family serine protease
LPVAGKVVTIDVMRLGTALSAVITLVALGAVAPARAEAAPGPVRAAGITLITGDRVTTTASGAVSVQRAAGRDGIRFVGRTEGSHRYVIPADALPLLRDGRLDQRLFDLTALREFGYTGDAELPLLVAYSRSGKTAARAAIGGRGRDLAGVGTLAVRVQRTARAGLWTTLTRGTGPARTLSPGIERVYLDGKRKLNLDVSVPQIGAPSAWQRGLDGAGVTVAVLDTGIDATHPDFAGKLAAVENFSADPSADDVVGHGTHVASTIAGSGAGSGGKYRGVAPGAELAIGKVCEATQCVESAVLAGMQWAAQHASVVNMSLGGWDTLGIDPLEQAVDDLTAAHGALFVIAAGNDGRAGTIAPLGNAASALTVGAVDDQDRLAGFSSRGPRIDDDAIKPDLTAPGVDIVAAGAANGSGGTPAGEGYVSMSGTSMAAPHVAGAAAIVTQQHPGWSPERRKALLMGAATPSAGVDVFGQGAGRVDVARVVRQAVSVDGGSVSFGRRQWPHTDDVPVTRTVTYRNDGNRSITLDLSLEGDTATFSPSSTDVTVPAGGTATTTVTADTGGEGTDGFKTARLVATGPGDVRVQTPLAVNREVESYDVTVRHLDRDGRPSADHYTSLNRLDGPGVVNLDSPAPEQTLRLAKGRYGIYGWVFGADDTSMLVRPELVIDGPTTIVLDARLARPVDITVPRPDAQQTLLAVDVAWIGADGYLTGAGTESKREGDTFLGQVGPPSDVDGFFGTIYASYARGPFGSPYSYDLAYKREGSFYTGFTKRLRARELATIKAGYAREADGADGAKTNSAELGTGFSGWAGTHTFPLPFARTEYVNTDDAVTWRGSFDQEVSGAVGPAERFGPGTVHRQEWNRAVVAPSVDNTFGATATRSGDVITAGVPLFSSGPGRWGWSATDSARTALYAGDDLIGEVPSDSGDFEVPAEPTDYRLEMSATRSAPFRLSTKVSAVWTFTSQSGDTTLPLSTVQLSPRLSAHNVARSGPFTIPVTVASAAALTAEFSVDDGLTWQPATVRGTGGRRLLRVVNPAPGFVSLRVHTGDAKGATASVTVLRAYETA